MSDVYDWSTNADDNNSPAPDGFPEGMPPSGVNNAAREVMAATKRFVDDLASDATDKGASLVGLTQGGTVQDAVYWHTPTGPDNGGYIDITDTLEAAMSNARRVIEIPPGDYVITREMTIPSGTAWNLTIRGAGSSTRLYVNVSAGGYAFKNLSDFVGGLTIENLQARAYDTQYDCGLIALEKSTRGVTLRNLWTYDMRKPIYLGDQIFGKCSLTDAHLYYLSKQDRTDSIAVHLKGNTTFLRNVDIIGGFNQAVYANACNVISIKDSNIAGSSGTDKLYEGIVTNGCSQVTLEDIWTEELDSSYSNGAAPAVKDTNSNTVTVKSVRVNTGSIFFIGTRSASGENNFFAQANGGYRYQNGADVRIIGGFNNANANAKWGIFGDTTNSRGTCQILDAAIFGRPGTGLSNNPTLLEGVTDVIAVTNGTLVTLSRETSNILTGNSARKVSVTSDNQGINCTYTGLKASTDYTFVGWIKVLSGTSAISTFVSTGTSVGRYPRESGYAANTDWQRVSLVGTTDASGNLTVRITATLDGAGPAEYLIDCCDVYLGYNPGDVRNFSHKRNRVTHTSEPLSGTWEVGDIIWARTPSAGGAPGWVCVTAGTPGTWKAMSNLSA